MEGLIYYQSMGSEFRYEDGKVFGTQPHLTCGSTSSYCVLHLNLIKGLFNIVIYTHTHTHQHTSSNQHGINHPKTLTYIYHGNSYQTQHSSIMHIISSNPRQQTTRYHKGRNIDMATSKTQVIAFQTSITHHATKHVHAHH